MKEVEAKTRQAPASRDRLIQAVNTVASNTSLSQDQAFVRARAIHLAAGACACKLPVDEAIPSSLLTLVQRLP